MRIILATLLSIMFVFNNIAYADGAAAGSVATGSTGAAGASDSTGMLSGYGGAAAGGYMGAPGGMTGQQGGAGGYSGYIGPGAVGNMGAPGSMGGLGGTGGYGGAAAGGYTGVPGGSADQGGAGLYGGYGSNAGMTGAVNMGMPGAVNIGGYVCVPRGVGKQNMTGGYGNAGMSGYVCTPRNMVRSMPGGAGISGYTSAPGGMGGYGAYGGTGNAGSAGTTGGMGGYGAYGGMGNAGPAGTTGGMGGYGAYGGTGINGLTGAPTGMGAYGVGGMVMTGPAGMNGGTQATIPPGGMGGMNPVQAYPGYPFQGRQPNIYSVGEPSFGPMALEISAKEKQFFEIETGTGSMQSQNADVSILNQFGYNYFRPDIGFSPLIDIPVGPDYVLGPGDSIILHLWGPFEGTQELEVNRSGEIELPRVGSVKVWGTTFGNLPALIRSNLAKIFKGFDFNITMGKLRLIKVFVVGEVNAPGDYNISSLSTLINALSAAGGPTKQGTLRNIQIRRRGAPPETVDLYDFFLKGDKSRDIRLMPGDTIFVPQIGKVAAVDGNVRRPAIYELKDEKSLKDLLSLADGINPTSYLHRVQILRVQAHEKQIAADFNLERKSDSKSIDELTSGVAIQDMDLVRVFPIDQTLRNSVRLIGYVLRPGDYELKPGMHVKDLIGADNLLPEHNTEVAVITRLIPPNLHPERIYINLNKAMAGDPKNNIELQEFDNLQVFSRWQMEEMPRVTISGEVQRPGVYRLYDNMRLRDLVLEAGNVRKTAFQGNAEITRLRLTKESVTSYTINVSLQDAMKENPDSNMLLQPYDEVQIRKIPDWMEETNRYVMLSGEVTYPGVYPIFKGEKLSSVLQRAGGFTNKAYLQGTMFTRVSVREMQQKRMDEIITKTEDRIGQKQVELTSTAASKEELDATKAALQGLSKNLEKLKIAKAEGRVTIKLSPLDVLKTTPYDIELMGGDTLNIPQSTNAVNVLGEVYNPTTFIQIPGKDVTYYLKKAGGPTGEAEEDEMYIIKADGSVISRQESSSFGVHWDDESKKWGFGGFFSQKLEPGDTLVVPQQIEKTAWIREIKDITTIISQIALSAGTIFLGLK